MSLTNRTEDDRRTRAAADLVTLAANGSNVLVQPTLRVTFNDPKRLREALYRMTGMLVKRVGQVEIRDGEWIAIDSAKVGDDLSSLHEGLAKCLEPIADRPLLPRALCDFLKITSAERRAWSKDGRLPTTRSASVRVGRQNVNIPQYPADAIFRLNSDPQIINQWRSILANDDRSIDS